MTLSVFSCEKIGPDGCSGPGILGYESINVISRIAFFCRINILSISILKVEPILLLHRQYVNIPSCNKHFSIHLVVKKGLSLYIMPIERDIFLDIFETCCFQLRVESIKTPKYFIYSFLLWLYY